MAEGLVRHHLGGRVTVASAGTRPEPVNPHAIAVMAEAGIPIDHQESTPLDHFLPDPWDAVITLCDAADRACPTFPGAAARHHLPFPDPARARGGPDEVLPVYRQVRDALAAQLLPFVRRLLDARTP